MKIQRAALVQHLRRVQCGGQIKEAIFGPGLEVNALTPDQLMLVVAPAIGEKVLETEVGLADLDKLRVELGTLASDGDEEGSAGEVDVTIDAEQKLVLDAGPVRGLRARLMTAQPRTIATRVDSKIVDQLVDKIGTDVVPLTPRVLKDVSKQFSALKAEEVTLKIGPLGGKIMVGEEHGDTAELSIPELKATEPFELVFGRHLIDALASVTDEAAVLYLSGPGGNAVVEDGEYRYILSPRHRSADKAKAAETKKAAKKAPKAKATVEEEA